jgi:hypothetical protein
MQDGKEEKNISGVKNDVVEENTVINAGNGSGDGDMTDVDSK